MITISIMLANIMQGVDNAILNVALPHIQGSLSALDQIAWALTSYIVCAAIMMPLTLHLDFRRHRDPRKRGLFQPAEPGRSIIMAIRPCRCLGRPADMSQRSKGSPRRHGVEQ
jgi:MFS family permease